MLTVFCAMESRTLQLVLQYDGSRFAGWQRQPDERTVQGVVEEALDRLCEGHVAVVGAGRTDAGVHALGQVAGIRVPDKWNAVEMRRALNAILPADVWVAASHLMKPEFHARFSAVSRAYRYLVGTDEQTATPFRSNRELAWKRPIDRGAPRRCRESHLGERCFLGFAVRGLRPRPTTIIASYMSLDGSSAMAVLLSCDGQPLSSPHGKISCRHDARHRAAGERQLADLASLLEASDNKGVSPPAPAHGLYLEKVEYPIELYLVNA